MLLHIPDILTTAEIAVFRDILSDDAIWRSGGGTAAGAARAAKHNLQADPSAPKVKGLLEKTRAALTRHPVFQAAAQPAAFARIIASKYASGMTYGAHVDAAYIDDMRTDLSFTLFLSDPQDYDGGALRIDGAGVVDEIKPPAGTLVLYPSTEVHEVAPVTRGERLAVVGWVKSRIRSERQRILVFELETALADLKTAGADESVRLRLINLRNNLLREFGD